MARVTQPPDEPGQGRRDAGSPGASQSGEQAAQPWYQGTTDPPNGPTAPDSGPPTQPLTQPGYEIPAQPAHETQARPGDGTQPPPGGSTPPQPGEGTQPAGGPQPGSGTQPLPRDWAQAQPSNGTPGQPGYGTQAEPGYGSQPGYGTQAQPGSGTPGQPGYGTAQPGYGTQAQPGYGAPPQTGYGTAQPGYGAPPQTGYGAPPQTGYGTAQPGYGTQAGYGSPGPRPYGYGTPYQAYPGTGYQYQFGKDPSLAEWWQRLLARIIDAVVVGVLASPFWLPPFATYVRQVQAVENLYNGNISSPAAHTAISLAGSKLFGSLVLAGIAGALIAMAYDWLQHGLWGQTLGKRAVGTMVVTADTRSKISGGAAGGRAAVYALPSAIPLIGGLFAAVNELWLLWDPRRQCLHDKAARTVVIKARSPAGPPYNPQASYTGGPAA